MKKLRYSVDIAAPAAIVWHALWDPVSYGHWTRPFADEGATVEGTWEEGGTQRFLWRDEHGSTGGMIAVVETSRAPEFLSLRFTGQVVEGVEDGGSTQLRVDVDVDQAYEEWADEKWPTALGLVRELAEPTEQVTRAD